MKVLIYNESCEVEKRTVKGKFINQSLFLNRKFFCYYFNRFYIIEYESGISVGEGKTQKDAINQAKFNFSKNSIEIVERTIQKYLEKYGVTNS